MLREVWSENRVRPSIRASLWLIVMTVVAALL